MASESILVVVGAGYIGSHMVLDLLHAGYGVIILDNLSRGHHDLLLSGTFIEGDMGDPRLLDRIFSQHQIAAVMYFAAFSLVGESVSKPLDYYRGAPSCSTLHFLLDSGRIRGTVRDGVIARGFPVPAHQSLRRNQARGRKDAG